MKNWKKKITFIQYSTSTENMRSDKSFTSSKHFKKLTISKVVVQILIATVQRHIVNELEKIQNAFL